MWAKYNLKTSVFPSLIISKNNFCKKWFLRYLLPKVGHFQVLIMSEGIHRNQVFLHQNVVQTLLYWNQLKPLAQNCAKNYYLHSPTEVLCSNLSNYFIFAMIWRKNCTFDRKNVIAFLTTFPHCGAKEITKPLIWRNIFSVR